MPDIFGRHFTFPCFFFTRKIREGKILVEKRDEWGVRGEGREERGQGRREGRKERKEKGRRGKEGRRRKGERREERGGEEGEREERGKQRKVGEKENDKIR